MFDQEVEVLKDFILKVYSERVTAPIDYDEMVEANRYLCEKSEAFHLNFIHPIGSINVIVEFKHIETGRCGGMSMEMVEGKPSVSRSVH